MIVKNIESMLGLSELKRTRVYQEALEEGKQEAKLETIPCMRQRGFSLEQIAQALDLPIEVVQQVATQQIPTSD
jgi:predicted transposase/invertase (TIGR01784 family)